MSRHEVDQRLRAALEHAGQGAQAVALIAHFSNDTPNQIPEPFRLTGLSSHGRRAVHEWAERCGRDVVSRSEGRHSDVASRCVIVEHRRLRDVVSWLSNTARALTLERQADTAELAALASASESERERRGITLVGLQVRACDAGGPGGRARLVLVSSGGGPLRAHKFSQRSEVEISGHGQAASVPVASDRAASVRGIVTRAATDELEVVALEAPLCQVQAFLDQSSPLLKVNASQNDATHATLKRTLARIKGIANSPPNQLAAALLRQSSFPDLNSLSCNGVDEATSSLNNAQLKAVAAALCAPPALCVHGPPGTGKTTTVAEIILQCAARGERVLACAPSNVAVDTLLEYVSRYATTTRRRSDRKKKISLLRLGHPARLAPEILRYSLESRIEKGDAGKVLQDARAELQEFEGARKYREARAVRKEIHRREREAALAELSAASVVFSTLVGAARLADFEDGEGPRSQSFDVVVIDEAAQALEIACWIPLLRCERCILAGDHKQLAPTVKTRDFHAARCLGSTLFENLISAGCPSVMLTTQYRMHRDISDWASETSYQGRLSPHSSCAARSLDGFAALAVIDTAGCDMHDDWNPRSGDKHRFASISNKAEADIVVGVVKRLLRCLAPSDVCVIAPYNAQVAILREHLFSTGVECKTVDGFQGGECEAVVLSLTRSNKKNVIGFLGDERRLNVAITRAKRHVTIVCDSDTVRTSPFIAKLLDYVADRGDYVYRADEISIKGEARKKPPPLISKGKSRSAERSQDKEKSSAGGAHADALSAAPSAAPAAAPVATPVDVSAAVTRDPAAESDSPSNRAVESDAPGNRVVETDAPSHRAVESDSPSHRAVESDAPGNQAGHPGRDENKVDPICEIADATLHDHAPEKCATFRVVFRGETHRVAAASTRLGDLQSALVAQFGIPAEKHKLVGAGLPLVADAQLSPDKKIILLEKPDAPPAPPSKSAIKKARRRELAALAAKSHTEESGDRVSPKSATDNTLLASLAADRLERVEQKSKVAAPRCQEQMTPSAETSSPEDDDAFLDAQIRRARSEAAAQKANQPPWRMWVDETGTLHNSSSSRSLEHRARLAKLLQDKIAQKQRKSK